MENVSRSQIGLIWLDCVGRGGRNFVVWIGKGYGVGD